MSDPEKDCAIERAGGFPERFLKENRMRQPLSHTAFATLAVCTMAVSANLALAEPSGGGTEAPPSTAPRRPIPTPIAIPASTVSWGMFARLPGLQASSIGSRHLASSELGLIQGWALYFRGLSAPYSRRPVQAEGAILEAYRRWLGGEVKALPSPAETAAIVSD